MSRRGWTVVGNDAELPKEPSEPTAQNFREDRNDFMTHFICSPELSLCTVTFHCSIMSGNEIIVVHIEQRAAINMMQRNKNIASKKHKKLLLFLTKAQDTDTGGSWERTMYQLRVSPEWYCHLIKQLWSNLSLLFSFINSRLRGREKEKEGENHQCERNINPLPLTFAPTTNQTCNPGLYPDRESTNWVTLARTALT